MKYYGVLKAFFLLIILLIIVIPGWMTFFDNGKTAISLTELLKDDSQLESNNLKITGKLLFKHAYKFEELLEEKKLGNVLWYVPFVSKEWSSNDTIKAIIVFDSGKRHWDSGFDKAVDNLEIKIDSLKTINNEVTILATYKKYEVFRWEEKAINNIYSNKNINIISKNNLLKLEVNSKHSLFGKIFVTVMVLILFLFVIQSLKSKNTLT